MCNLVHEMHETATNNTDGQAAAVEDVDGVVMVDILNQPQESIPATQRTTRRTITQPAHDDEHSNTLCNRLLDRILEHPNISYMAGMLVVCLLILMTFAFVFLTTK